MQAVKGASSCRTSFQAHLEAETSVILQAWGNQSELFGSRSDISSQPCQSFSYTSYRMALFHSHFAVTLKTTACQHDLLAKHLGEAAIILSNLDSAHGTILMGQEMLDIRLPHDGHVGERSYVFEQLEDNSITATLFAVIRC